MNRQVATLLIWGLVGASVCSGQVPRAVFVGEGPGINVPFLDNGDVDTYGVAHWVDGFSWDGSGGATGSNGWGYYGCSVTSDPGNLFAMPADQDWVFEVSMKRDQPDAASYSALLHFGG